MEKVAHMLTIGKIEEGFVLDHIRAGRAMRIYHYLGLDKLDCPVAIIKNARSGEMGKKDILKVECDVDSLNLDALAFIDRNITVNVIQNGQIKEKRHLKLPKELHNIVRCSNPRCITSVERGLPHIFYLADEKTGTYRCQYCDERYEESDSEKYMR
jgi:aspartate carbamoyltransferase regulatory subunit